MKFELETSLDLNKSCSHPSFANEIEISKTKINAN